MVESLGPALCPPWIFRGVVAESLWARRAIAVESQIKRTVSETRARAAAEVFAEVFSGSGVYLYAHDVREKRKSKPAVLANMMKNTRRYCRPIRETDVSGSQCASAKLQAPIPSGQDQKLELN